LASNFREPSCKGDIEATWSTFGRLHFSFILKMFTMAILSTLALYCRASANLDLSKQLDLKTFEAKFNSEFRLYKTSPAKAKKRFFTALSKLGSKKSIQRILTATAEHLNSKSKFKDAIVRRVIKKFKQRGAALAEKKGSAIGSRLLAKVSPSITNV
jgi:hypothetical protein